MRITQSGWMVPALFAWVSAGCGGGSTTTPVEVRAAGPADATASSRDDSTVKLTEVSVAQWEAAIAAHKGKVVLVDVWFYG